MADVGGYLEVGTDPDILEPKVKVVLTYDPLHKSNYKVSGINKMYVGDRVLMD